MLSSSGIGEIGNVNVTTTSGRGFNPAELTALAMAKILYVGDSAPPAIRDQASAYRARIEDVLLSALTQAQRSERTTIIALLEQAGHLDAAALVRKI